jgi:hypothetical protein
MPSFDNRGEISATGAGLVGWNDALLLDTKLGAAGRCSACGTNTAGEALLEDDAGGFGVVPAEALSRTEMRSAVASNIARSWSAHAEEAPYWKLTSFWKPPEELAAVLDLL